MTGPLNRHNARKLASLIVAFILALTLQPTSADAGSGDKSCQPTVPHELSPSEFEELRKDLWEIENLRDLKPSFEIKPHFSDHPFFPLLLSARNIDRGIFIEALINLEGLDILSQRSDFCQHVFVSEIAMVLRHFTISSFISEDPRLSKSWNSLRAGGLRYFAIGDIEKAKCIVLNAGLESLKLDREPTFEEYPRHCLVR